MIHAGSILLSALGFLAITTAHAAEPIVHIALRSSWPAPPLLLEIIETISLENEDAFFPTLDALTHPETLPRVSPSSSTTPEAAYEFALAAVTASGLVPDSAPIAAALALHAAAPRIEAFYAHYRDTHGSRVDLAGKPGCESWVDWYGSLVCDLENLRRLLGHESLDPANDTGVAPPPTPRSRPKILSFDHIYPPSHGALHRPPRTAILYGHPFSSNFRELHSYLLAQSTKPDARVEYIFRHAIPQEGLGDSKDFAYLSGYGVSLDLKKMEYLAVDDRSTGSRDISHNRIQDEATVTEPDIVAEIINVYPVNSSADATAPLTEEELQNLGAQAAQIIADGGEHSLAIAQKLAQNFPKYAASLARRVKPTENVTAEIGGNVFALQPGLSTIWLNGVNLGDGDMNPYALLRIMRKERAVVRSLREIGLTSAEAVDLLTHEVLGQSQSTGAFLDQIFDASDRLEGGEAITWWNDIEKDSRYSRWRPTMYTLIQPLYPGQFHQIKLNIYNIILAVDLSQPKALHFITSAVSSIISRSFPFRWGIVPLVETEDGVKMARLVHYLVKTYGRSKTMNFIKALSRGIASTAPGVDWDLVRDVYTTFAKEDPPTDDEGTALRTPSIDEILSGDALGSVDKAYIDSIRAYADRLGVTLRDSPQGHAFINGKHHVFDDDFLRNMQSEINAQLQHLQELVYGGQLEDKDAERMSTYFYDLPTSNTRRNPYIYPTSKDGLRVFSLPDLFGSNGLHKRHAEFVYPLNDEPPSLSMQLITDLDSPDGLALAEEALLSLDEESQTRLSFIHNPGNQASKNRTATLRPSTLVSHLLASNALGSITPKRLLAALGLDSTSPEAQKVLAGEDSTMSDLLNGNAEPDPGAYARYTRASATLVDQLGLSAGANGILVNGRLVGPFPVGAIKASDFKALAAFELRKRCAPVLTALTEIKPAMKNLPRYEFTDLVSMASSVVAAVQVPDPTEAGLYNKPMRPRQRTYNRLSNEYTGFTVGDNNTAILQFGAILDPLSESAQKWTSLFEWLSSFPDVYLDVRLNPAMYQEVPLKRFYRYSVLSRPRFTEKGDPEPAAVVISGLPTQPIYTLAMDVPISWLVRPRESKHDLDNIQLSHLHSGESIQAVFVLDYLVIEGHAREVASGAPPRGLQLQLIDGAGQVVGDTQVVENLGYLQLKAKPGVFHLRIREGRGREIFKMVSVGNEGWDSPTVETVGDEISVINFEGLTLYPRVDRLPGMEKEDVLAAVVDVNDDDDDEGKGVVDEIVSKITDFFKSKPETKEVAVATNQTQQADINIFTVASGLLYERFSSIMVLSVLRNTKSKVKFWFIENFLSPSFLEFIPHFAAEYGFDYELVTYKWPSWLRAQKEKQRIIWAYKILFLDVLFPLDLKKVIFVDADQIVRTDMKELVDLDLHGAPYGYTPMGDDNTDMEGFRFWKTGYWKDFLRGKPYHISALYVVDLVRFRQMAAGDILRGQYQQLSADPNSLANLDQDLPNNLQFQVPIFSLHEDWLWCETWCSKDRLHRAKTIDLCQNPLTKEPKLARARAIPEWSGYDAEIAEFTRKLAAQGKITSSLTGADVNALAGDVGGSAVVSPEGAKDERGEAEQVGVHVKDEL